MNNGWTVQDTHKTEGLQRSLFSYSYAQIFSKCPPESNKMKLTISP